MTITEIVLDRAIGTVGGFVIACWLVPPGRWLPLRRAGVAGVSGMMLTPLLAHYFAWEQNADNIIGAACIVSCCSWWAWHAALKALDAGWLPQIKWRRSE